MMGMVRPIGQMLDIYVHALAATPRVAFIPLIIVLLGLGFQAKVLIVFLGAVMPVILNSLRRRARRRCRPRGDGAGHRRLAAPHPRCTSCCPGRCRSCSPASGSALPSG